MTCVTFGESERDFGQLLKCQSRLSCPGSGPWAFGSECGDIAQVQGNGINHLSAPPKSRENFLILGEVVQLFGQLNCNSATLHG